MDGSGSIRVGIDLVEVDRIERLLDRDSAIYEKVFSDTEQRYARGKRFPFQRFAARFAAKEALFKAMGTGLSGDLDWRDIEVRNERSGKPVLRLSGSTAIKANEMGVMGSYLSLSHTEKYAIALVILIVGK